MPDTVIPIGMIPVRILGEVEVAEGEPSVSIVQVERLDTSLSPTPISLWVSSKSLIGPLDSADIGHIREMVGDKWECLSDIQNVKIEDLLRCPMCGRTEDILINATMGSCVCSCLHSGSIISFMRKD